MITTILRSIVIGMAFVLYNSNAASAQRNSYEKGKEDGSAAAKKLFQNYEYDCDYYFDFTDEAELLSGSGSSLYRRGYDKGVKAYISAQAKKCLSVEECDDIGSSIASMIADEECPSFVSFAYKLDYEEICEEESKDTCKGQISSKFKSACGSYPSRKKLEKLKDKCIYEIDSFFDRRILRGGDARV